MEKEKEDLRLIVEQALGDPVKQQQLQFARCLFDFEARNEEELELKAGDIVVVTDTRDNNGWWQVRRPQTAQLQCVCGLHAFWSFSGEGMH